MQFSKGRRGTGVKFFKHQSTKTYIRSIRSSLDILIEEPPSYFKDLASERRQEILTEITGLSIL